MKSGNGKTSIHLDTNDCEKSPDYFVVIFPLTKGKGRHISYTMDPVGLGRTSLLKGHKVAFHRKVAK